MYEYFNQSGVELKKALIGLRWLFVYYLNDYYFHTNQPRGDIDFIEIITLESNIREDYLLNH